MERLIWDRERMTFAPRSEVYARRAPAKRSDLPAPTVMGDIDDYQSIIDGTRISSRSAHRNHLRQHGCEEVGNERLPQRKAYEPQGVEQDVKRAYEELS